MKKFNVKVNGKTYEVEVEETGFAQPSFTYVPVQPAPAVQAAPPVAPAPATAAPAPVAPAPKAKVSGETITAPMPGTVLDIKVSEGQTVKDGDIILILEAMKMENEITAPKAGTVYLNTSKGATVNTGEELFTLA